MLTQDLAQILFLHPDLEVEVRTRFWVAEDYCSGYEDEKQTSYIEDYGVECNDKGEEVFVIEMEE